MSSKESSILISYASEDYEVAKQICDRLAKAGMRPSLLIQELEPGLSLVGTLRDKITASDYLMILLSPAAIESQWVYEEVQAALVEELLRREVLVLPVIVKPCRVPPFLASHVYLDLTRNFEMGLRKLVDQLRLAPSLDLRSLEGFQFERLVFDLLRSLGFKDLKDRSRVSDRGYDMIAKYDRKDPFGKRITETWVVEVKAGRGAEANLRSLQSFVGSLPIFQEPVNGLFVTAGQLSSPAHKWLEDLRIRRMPFVRVLEGPELRKLLLKKQRLVYKYFPQVRDSHDHRPF